MAKGIDYSRLNRLKQRSRPSEQAFPSGGRALRNEGFPTDEERNNDQRTAAVEAAKKRRRLHLIADAARKLNG